MALLARKGPRLGLPLHAARYSSTNASAAAAQLSPRWLSDAKQRIGKCITWGLTPPQTVTAGAILSEIARDWRELVAGSEGWLTSPDRVGLSRWPIAWGDQDSMVSLSAAPYLECKELTGLAKAYAESGRVAWAQKYAYQIDPAHKEVWRDIATPKGEIGMILRKITTEFKFPMKYPDHISVYHKLHSEPTETSDGFMLDVVILSELQQRIAARLYEDCALYNYKLNKKTTMPSWMAKVLGETWRLQEEAKRVNSGRVWGLLDQITKLEKESWDREGAVEDMGNAKS